MVLSIVTINRNNATGLKKTHDSIVSQVNQDFRWVVIDGNSTDSSISLLSSRVDCLICEDDEGIYDAMNKGLQLTRNDHVLFLNSGDKFSTSYATLNIIQNIDCSNILYFDIIISNEKGPQRTWITGDYTYLKALFGWHPPHPGFIFLNKKYSGEYSAFTLRYQIAADYAFMMKLLIDEKVSPKYLASKLVEMEAGGVSNSSLKNIFVANKECLDSWRHRFKLPPYWLLFTKPFSKIFQFWSS